jgi:hypothetical protein
VVDAEVAAVEEVAGVVVMEEEIEAIGEVVIEATGEVVIEAEIVEVIEEVMAEVVIAEVEVVEVAVVVVVDTHDQTMIVVTPGLVIYIFNILISLKLII